MIFRRKVNWPRFTREDWVNEIYDSNIVGRDEFLEKIAQHPELLSSVVAYSLPNAILDFIRKKDQFAFLERLQFAHQCLTWHYHGLFNEGPHHVSIPGIPPFTFEGRFRPNIDVAHRKWMKAMYIAMTLRDNDAMEVYAKVPYKPFGDRGGLKQNPYQEPFTKAKQLIWTDPESAIGYLDSAIELARPEHISDMDQEQHWRIDNLLIPNIQIWQLAIGNDEEAFNRHFRERVKIYKKLHLKEPNGPNRMELFLPFNLIAPACIAHDRGMKITVRSDYLPEFLVKGDFERVEWRQAPPKP